MLRQILNKTISLILRLLYWFPQLFYKNNVLKHYISLKTFYRNNNVNTEKLLINLLYFAKKNSKFYKDLIKEGEIVTLSSFPIINRDVIVNNFNNIIVDKNHVPFQKGEILFQKTSGTSGKPLKIAFNSEKVKRRIAELKYFTNISGVKSHEKIIQLRCWKNRKQKSIWQCFKENIIPIDISNLSEDHLDKLSKIINKKRAVCLRGHASSLITLGNYISKNNITIKTVKLIISGSEYLSLENKKFLSKVFNCKVQNQYANEECGILAQNIINSGTEIMYLNNASYFFEFLKLDSDKQANVGELCRIIVTDLYNYSFPLIRYDTGDLCILGEKDIYSNDVNTIQELYGRYCDLTFNTIGEPISPMVYYSLLKNYDDYIKEWKFIQLNKNNYSLTVIPKKLISNIIKNEIIIKLKNFLGENATIDIKLTDTIEKTLSFKRKCVTRIE